MCNCFLGNAENLIFDPKCKPSDTPDCDWHASEVSFIHHGISWLICSQNDECIQTWLFPGASLKLNGAPENIQGNLALFFAGLGSNTYLYLQIQIQIQIRRICICICIWSNFKPCICICIWSIVFGVFDKYVFKYTFSWAVFWTQIYGKRLTWIFFINMLKSAILFQNKCRGLILPIPIGGCVCALDLACQWVCDKPLA